MYKQTSLLLAVDEETDQKDCGADANVLLQMLKILHWGVLSGDSGS